MESVVPPESALLTTLMLVGDWAVRIGVAAFIVLRSRSTPAVRLSWLLVVLALPLVGAAIYVLVGEVRLGRRRAARHSAVIADVRRYAEQNSAPRVKMPGAGAYRKGAILIEALGGLPPRPGNRLRLFGGAKTAVDCLIADVEAAERSCHVLTYIYLDDDTGRRMAAALLAAVERGVTCRLLVDAVGSRPFLRSSLCARLRAGGVRVVGALPVGPLRGLFSRLDHRNHRKIAVIDGLVGWTGSQNIADADFAVKAKFAPWIDLMVRIEGPVVGDLQLIFSEDWVLDSGEEPAAVLTPPPQPLADGVTVQIIGSGPCAETEAMRDLSLLGFLETDEELVLTTPYFVPDEPTVAALVAIARSGVRTVLVLPKCNDSPLVSAASRSYYQRLLEAGAEIHEYGPGLLHAKTFTFDGKVGVVATANLDRRSFELNYEVSTVVVDEDFTRELHELQLGYVSQSERVNLETWKRRPWPQRLWQNSIGMLAPLL